MPDPFAALARVGTAHRDRTLGNLSRQAPVDESGAPKPASGGAANPLYEAVARVGTALRDGTLHEGKAGDPAQDPQIVKTPVRNCARCGGNHDLAFQPLTNPPASYTHWAPCPTSGQPILMRVEDDLASEVTGTVESVAGFRQKPSASLIAAIQRLKS